MGGDSWLIMVSGVLGAVLIGFVAVAVVRSQPSSSRPGPGQHRYASPSSPFTVSLGRGVGYLYGRVGMNRPWHSVNHSMERACSRISEVDPHAAPRRVGEALAQAGWAGPLGPVPPVDDALGNPNASDQTREQR